MNITTHRIHDRTPRRVFATLATFGLAAGLLAGLGTTARAAATSCRALNRQTHVITTDLQAALSAATAGDTIQIKGVCKGNFSIDKSLHLVGRPTVAVPEATLDGGNAGSVVHTSGLVTYKDLLITNGNNPSFGGGIDSAGNFTVRLLGATKVSHNVGGCGGGVCANGTVSLQDSVQVNDNEAGGLGGGVTAGRFVMSGSAQVNGNISHDNGGGIWANRATLSGAAQIDGNFAARAGGGIYVGGTEGITISDSVQVDGNSSHSGGGVYTKGPVVLSGSAEIDNNTTTGNGGGLFIFQKQFSFTITLKDSATVTGNTAAQFGGILSQPGLVLACNGSGLDEWIGAISPNTPDDAPAVTPITC